MKPGNPYKYLEHEMISQERLTLSMEKYRIHKMLSLRSLETASTLIGEMKRNFLKRKKENICNSHKFFRKLNRR